MFFINSTKMKKRNYISNVSLLNCILLLIMLINSGTSATCKSKNPRIIIVGAGASGIAAASKLFENGFTNVKILEAEDRIGGRVYTTRFGNYNVDMGGQWVHGEKGNVVFDLAYPLGLLEATNETNYGLSIEYYDSNGNFLDEALTKNITDFFFNYCYETDSNNNTAYKSEGHYIEEMFEKVFKNVPAIYKDKNKYLKSLELSVSNGAAADTWYDIEPTNSDHYKSSEGDHLTNWKERGYSTILDVLMKRYPSLEKELPVVNNTILNAEVASIEYENSPIEVKTVQGQSYVADHVIVTVSLGVLKDKYETLFQPPLPEYKIETIKGLGYGVVAKIYLLYSEPFWNLEGKRIRDFTFIWNDDERKMIENDPEKSWVIGVICATTVEHKPNLLELWLGEKHAKDMESLSEEKVFRHTVETLDRFLHKTFNVTEPVAMLRSRWHSNPHFKGAYSYRSIESLKKNASAKALEQPVTLTNLAILFAGEATSSHRFSTVDGAVGSGWNAANRLIDCYNKN